MYKKYDYPITKVCQYCNEPYDINRASDLKKKFCTNSCRIANGNKNRIYTTQTKDRFLTSRGSYSGNKNPNYKGGGLIFNCLECKIEFSVPRHAIEKRKHSGKYCSKDCCYIHKGKNKMSLSQQKLNKKYTRTFSKVVTKYSDNIANKWLNPFGYTVTEFKTHMESLFKDGMTWSNHGDWHIDHIKPVSAFNFTLETDIEFIECWQLNNLQPLWAKDNLSKGGMNRQINKNKYGKKKTTPLCGY